MNLLFFQGFWFRQPIVCHYIRPWTRSMLDYFW